MNGEARTTIEHQVLGGVPVYTLAQMSELTGVPEEKIESYWLWLGQPIYDPNKVAFTEADVAWLKELGEIMDVHQFDENALKHLVRAMGNTTERMATWQVESFVDHLTRAGAADDHEARRAALTTFVNMVNPLARQLEHAWRRATLDVVSRYHNDLDSRGESQVSSELPLQRAIGFADIVGYTKMTAEFDKFQLASFLGDKESYARDIISRHGGRVIKTIGDAIMYACDDIYSGANIAIALSSVPDGPGVVKVRVGLVFGPVLARYGDAFGPSVNLAARLTSLADPDSVVIDPVTAELLEGDDRYVLTLMDQVEIKGMGTIRPIMLSGRNLR
jgi:adenylate cyclase